MTEKNTVAVQLIAPSSGAGRPEFRLPVSENQIQSVQSVDLDLVITTVTGEKLVLQQAALQALTQPESRLVFRDGKSVTAADQLKKVGMLKPVEGGSFRLQSEKVEPSDPKKLTGQEFGLGREIKDIVQQLDEKSQQLEKMLQEVKVSSGSRALDNLGEGLGPGTGIKSSTPVPNNMLASPVQGSPAKPEKEAAESAIKITNTPRTLLAASSDVIPNVKVVDKSQSAIQGREVLKDFSQATLREMLPVDPLQVRVSGDQAIHLEPGGKAVHTLVMPGVLNAASLRFEVPYGTQLPKGFSIGGQDFNGNQLVVSADSLQDLLLDFRWSVIDKVVGQQSRDFQLGVKYLDAQGNELALGREPLTFTYGELKSLSDTVQLDGNSQTKIFLSAFGYKFDVRGDGENNTITSGHGDDRIDGGGGADRMTGGKGNDTYLVDSTGDMVIEAAGEGTDTVESSISYALTANLENLMLIHFEN